MTLARVRRRAGLRTALACVLFGAVACGDAVERRPWVGLRSYASLDQIESALAGMCTLRQDEDGLHCTRVDDRGETVESVLTMVGSEDPPSPELLVGRAYEGADWWQCGEFPDDRDPPLPIVGGNWWGRSDDPALAERVATRLGGVWIPPIDCDADPCDVEPKYWTQVDFELTTSGLVGPSTVRSDGPLLCLRHPAFAEVGLRYVPVAASADLGPYVSGPIDPDEVERALGHATGRVDPVTGTVRMRVAPGRYLVMAGSDGTWFAAELDIRPVSPSVTTVPVPVTEPTLAPQTTAPPTTAPPTSAPPTTPPLETTLPTTTVPSSEPPILLIGDDDGLRRWVDGTDQWILRDRPIASALADRVGGVVFQDVETGMWDLVQPADPTFRFHWVGTGAPEPIRHIPRLAGPEEVVVTPGPGESLRIVDTALVEGRPHLLYQRTMYSLEPTAGAPVIGEELVVRDLDTGFESVVRRWDGFEGGLPLAALGPGLVALTAAVEGDPAATLTFLTFDGDVVEMPGAPSGAPSGPWCTECGLLTDLAPDDDRLVAVTEEEGRLGVQVMAIATETWTQLASVTLTPGVDGTLALRYTPAMVDAADGRSLIAVAGIRPVDEFVTLRPGDRGAWVRLLQERLVNVVDEPLVRDGIFGPATEAAVRQFQSLNGLRPTGVVDVVMWEMLGTAPMPILEPLVVLDADGTTTTVVITNVGEPVVDRALYDGDRWTPRAISLWTE